MGTLPFTLALRVSDCCKVIFDFKNKFTGIFFLQHHIPVRLEISDKLQLLTLSYPARSFIHPAVFFLKSYRWDNHRSVDFNLQSNFCFPPRWYILRCRSKLFLVERPLLLLRCSPIYIYIYPRWMEYSWMQSSDVAILAEIQRIIFRRVQ